MSCAGGDAVMTSADAGPGQALALPDAAAQQRVVRENVPDPLAGEQTWPTSEVRTCWNPPPLLNPHRQLLGRGPIPSCILMQQPNCSSARPAPV